MTGTRTVAIESCPAYGPGVAGCVESLLARLGGIPAFCAPGQTVLLKPNLLTDRAPEQAVTTHPDVVRALIRMVRDCGARPVVADSPASATKLSQVWHATGYASMCNEETVPLVSLEQGGSVACERDGYRFNVARIAMDADVIVNVPKVKTHVLTTLTAAVKNLYGLLPGFQKAMLHARHPAVSDFGGLLRAIHASIPPVLSVADAIVGMQGEGPSGGDPVTLGFLAASTDALALDLVLCDLLGIRPRAVPYLRDQRPLSRRDDIVRIGADVDALRPDRFHLPSTVAARLIPGRLARAVGMLVWIRPRFTEACIRCGRCTQACPADAIRPDEGNRPVLDGRLCIGCCCCHEVCPAQAVEMTQSRLLRMVRRGKPL